ncbi:Hypothetical predicted protein [Pelobates cultripes]|uniref:Uncharacterized protein n=1 Tax=Pelobates cultripes TaxID=61616 RepID=A0AAD1WRW6_PELCU|nr:Hypothetical predicted protein [Pelobates cultripes]
MSVTQPTKSVPKGSDSSPVTTEVLTTLLATLQNTILADTAKIRKDIRGLSGRLGTLEGTSGEHTKQISSLQREIDQLHRQHKSYDQHLATMEETRHKNNVKIRGTKEDIPIDELPHLLPMREGRAVGLEESFRIPKREPQGPGGPLPDWKCTSPSIRIYQDTL